MYSRWMGLGENDGSNAISIANTPISISYHLSMIL